MAGGRWTFVFLFCFSARILAFNIDTSVPIVKEGVSPDAYFGFSVAQHIIYNPRTGDEEHVLLVGAPKDNVTLRDVPASVRALNKPGVVYKCDFTSNLQDCEQLRLLVEAPRNDEVRSEQWLGVAVSSKGTTHGRAAACAHRYRHDDSNSYSWPEGYCVSMTNALDEDLPFMPCRGLSTSGGHATYGSCQAGTSLAIGEAPTSGWEILIGVPGPYNWRGSVMKNIIPEGLEPMTWYVSPVEDIPSSERGTPPVVNFYSYMGMASHIARVLDRQNTYIAGAPRAENLGQVLLFTQGSSELVLKARLEGDQFGAGFGSSVTTVDLNNDGYNDLVVGSPFYYDEKNGGAIYVYMNGPEGISNSTEPTKIFNRKMPPEECAELNCLDSRFGFSLENIGDIDQDGYEDLAVGAPFEGNGAIYIFRGSPDGIREKYSQRIAASDLLSARPLESFGYSISGGNDMDGNQYPDIIVGAYESNKVIALRSRPVVNIVSAMRSEPTLIDSKKTNCESGNDGKNCFKLQVCFRWEGNFTDPSVVTSTLDVEYRVEAEIFTGVRSSRVSFKQAEDTTTPYVLEKSIKVARSQKCIPHTVYIKQNNRDFLHPINFRVTHWLKEQVPPTMRPGDSIPELANYPVLNADYTQFDLAVHFKKDCGQDQACQSSLVLQANFPDLNRDEITNNPVYKIGQSKDKRFELQVTVVNFEEDAHDTKFFTNLPQYLQFVNTDTDEFTCIPENGWLSCDLGNPLGSGQQVMFGIIFDAKDVQPTTHELEFNMHVNTTSTEVDPADDSKDITLRVIVETDMLVRSTKSDEIYYGGEVRGESAIKKEEEIGSPVIHTYEVKNSGDGKVLNSTVTISWPYQVMNDPYPKGKHLLYMLEPPRIDAPGECFMQPGQVNAIGVELNPKFSLDTYMAQVAARESTEAEGKSRKKRMAPIQHTYVQENGKRLKVVYMDCNRRLMNGHYLPASARCFNFDCRIGLLMPGQSVAINIRARIWNSTFVEDYRNVDQVRVSSTARITIDHVLNIQQTDTDNDIAHAVTIAVPDVKIKERPSIQLWVIIVAALGGLLLLIIIIILLWKCGFFKRARHADNGKHTAVRYKPTPNNDFDYYN